MEHPPTGIRHLMTTIKTVCTPDPFHHRVPLTTWFKTTKALMTFRNAMKNLLALLPYGSGGKA